MFPHPMILGQVVAMTALHLGVLHGSRYYWLLPVHCAFYLTHMLQEIFDEVVAVWGAAAVAATPRNARQTSATAGGRKSLSLTSSMMW